MNQLPLGEMAALAAAMVWAFTSLIFTRAGHLVSPIASNTFKCTVAAVVFTLLSIVRFGTALPPGIAAADIGTLAVSGMVGLALGDSLLFTSFVLVGTRKGLLLLSLAPVMGSIGGFFLFGERLNGVAISGILVALAGVVWVISESAGNGRDSSGRPSWSERRPALLGTLAGIGAAASQAGGALLVKGPLVRVDWVAATHIRLLAATFVLLVAAGGFRRLLPWAKAFLAHRLVGILVLGSMGSQVIAVLLMTVSLGLAPAGISLTLLATVPIWLLPFGKRIGHGAPTRREVIGILIALSGVAILLLRPA